MATVIDPHLLEKARGGHEDAFRALAEPYRRELLAHAYRVLGSFHDAEDAVQDAMLRAWRGLAGYEGRASFRTWLHKIATNSILDFAERRKARSLPPYRSEPGGPAGEPLLDSGWLEPFPDALLPEFEPGPESRLGARESVALAFLHALQQMPPKQRVVLLSRDVLGLSAAEVAEILGVTVAAVNSLLQRARESVEAKTPAQEPDDVQRDLLSRYLRAWESADVAALKAIFRDDVRLSMPPLPGWYQGADAVLGSLAAMVFAEKRSFRAFATRANGLPAIASYEKNAAGVFVPQSIHTVRIERGRIAEIVAFLDGSLHGAFGLPAELR